MDSHVDKELELFNGIPRDFGGLSNEKELVKLVPQDFRTAKNGWTRYASELFFKGDSTKDWKWKINNEEIRIKRLSILYGLLMTFGIDHNSKEAIAGWMLSEMLTEIPKHGQKKRTTNN